MDQGMPYYLQESVNDEKVRDIIRCFTGKGFTVLISIRQYMTRNAGFWCKLSDVPRTLEIFPEVKHELALKVVKRAARIGIFDMGMFTRYNVLTSSAIQKNYFSFAGNRPNLEYDARFLLIDPQVYLKEKEAEDKQKAAINERRAQAAAPLGSPTAERSPVPKDPDGAADLYVEILTRMDIEQYRIDLWLNPMEPKGFDPSGNLILSAPTATHHSVIMQTFLDRLNCELAELRPGAKVILQEPHNEPPEALPDAPPPKADMSLPEAAEWIKIRIGYDAAVARSGSRIGAVLDEFVNLYSRACTDPAKRKYSGMECDRNTFIGLMDKLTPEAAYSLARELNDNDVRDRYHYLCGAIVKHATNN
jgi:hypothetical protein